MKHTHTGFFSQVMGILLITMSIFLGIYGFFALFLGTSYALSSETKIWQTTDSSGDPDIADPIVSKNVYIDPTYAGSPRDGSISQPYNNSNEIPAAWIISPANKTYLFKRGTTHYGSINFSNQENINIGAYGEGPRPKLIYTGDGYAVATTFYLNPIVQQASSTRIVGLDISATKNADALIRLTSNTTVENCYLHNAQWGIRSTGDPIGEPSNIQNVKIINSVIEDIADDGMYIQNVNGVIVEDNLIQTVNQNYYLVGYTQEEASGDGIQFVGNANWQVKNNKIDRSDTANKFNFITSYDKAIPPNIAIIEGNTFISPRASDQGGAIFYAGYDVGRGYQNTGDGYSVYMINNIFSGALPDTALSAVWYHGENLYSIGNVYKNMTSCLTNRWFKSGISQVPIYSYGDEFLSCTNNTIGNVVVTNETNIPILSTPYISNGIMGVRGITGFYKGTIDIKADVFDFENIGISGSSCEYTIGGSRLPASYSGTTTTGYCYQTDIAGGSDLTINFRVKNLSGNEGLGMPRYFVYDNVPPTFTLDSTSGPECQTGTMNITSPYDIGGLHAIPYSFNGVDWTGTTTISIPAQQPGVQIITGWLRDIPRTQSYQTATYTFNDVVPTANNFTGDTNVGSDSKTVNWKTLSSATEGNCGNISLTYSGIVSQGTKGTCDVVGDTITYTPNTGQSGTDICIIQINDNENSTGNIAITWDGITTSDTTVPIVNTFTIPTTGNSLSITISSFTASDNVGISGYLVNESSNTPSSGDAGWTSTPRTEYTFSSTGSKILYARAKDAVGNISTSVSATVIITVPSSINRNNDTFIDNNFWASGPNETDVIQALYGSGTEGSIYTKYWDNNNCDPAGIDVQYLNGGLDKIPQQLSNNTIYVLNSGDYTLSYLSGVWLSGCSAIVGSGNVNVYSTDQIGVSYAMFYSNGQGNIIIDTINIDGRLNGSLGSHASNVNGIMFITTSNNTINNIQSYKNMIGINLTNADRNTINNSQSYNNIANGIGLSGSSFNLINNSQTYNNYTNGIGMIGYSRYNTINNSQSYNNDIGINLTNSDSNTVNNSQSYNNTSIGIYFTSSSNNTINNLKSYNNRNGILLDGSPNNTYYGILKLFLNTIGNISGGSIGSGIHYPSLGWATGAIDTGGSIDCSRITNPVTAGGLYLQTSSLCDNRGFIDSWTGNIANNYRYGSNISPQIQTVQGSGAGIFLYGIAGSTYDTGKYIGHYGPVGGTFSIENNTGISYTTGVLLYTTIAGASQMNFSNNGTARSILESYNGNKSWTLEGNTPGLKIVYADFSGSNGIFMAADTIDLILPPTVSTGYISLGTTGIHGNTGYYIGIIDIQADTSTPGAMSGCEYTTGVSRAIADYNGSSISGYCYKTGLHYTSDITINFRAIDYNGHVGTGIPTTYIYDETPPTFTFTNSSGDECVAGILEITNAVDTGIGLHLYPYNFSYNPNLRDNNQAKIITGQQAGEITTIPGWIRDAFGNSTQIQTSTYTFNDVVPTADNFTYGKNIGNSIKTGNWKILSSASEGSCGNLDLSFSGILTNGTKGICNIAGDIITYNPSPEQTGSDNCTIQIKDNENSTTNITITWVNINTSTPIITNVASDKDNGSYGSGEIIDINVQFSEAVKVTGIPKLKLNTNPIRTGIYIDMGLFDMTFDSGSGFDRDVYTTAIQHDGKILVGGIFQTYNNTPANKIIRLNTDGSRDDTFNILNGFDNNRVNKILIQNDGKILVGGSFTGYNGILANRIIRLNADGSRDETFNIGNGFDWYVHTMAIQDDGKILVGGNFSNYQSYTYNKIIRLNPDGARDTTFSNNNLFLSSYPINTIAIQNDGKILVGGDFYQGGYVQTNRIIRLDYDGSQDTSFDVGTGFDNNVEKILIQNDGKILVGGQFSGYKGTPANRIIRLNTGGSIDTSFDIGSGFNGTIITLNIQNDDKILVGGGFTSYKGTPTNRIIRLNTDGSIDTSFDLSNVFDTSFTGVMTGFYTGFLGSTYLSDISIQKDGNIIVGGNFQNFNSTNKGIARLSEYNSNQTFRYTVQTGDISSDLDYTDINALNLDGGTIQDIYAYNANILLFTTGAVGSLGFNKDLVIGTTTFTPPTVSTGIISIGTTGNNGSTFYYQGSVTIKADVNSGSHALSGATCEYTTGLSRAPAIYNTTHCTATGTWTDTLTIRFRIADLLGNVTTGATGTYIYDATASTIPTLISPIAGTIFTTTPSLNWEPSTDVGIGMSGYYYQLSTDNTFVALTQQGTGSTNSWNPTVLNNGTTYYWRVRSFDTFYNTSIFSSTGQFTVSTISPPTVSTGIISIGTTGNNGPTLYYQGSVTIKADVNSGSHALSGATCEYTTGLSRAPAIYNTTHCTAIGTWTDTLTIRFRIADISGNVTTGATGTYIYDATPPVGGTFVINNGLDSTASTSVTLNTTCPTDSGIGGTQIAFGNTQNPTNRQTCSASLSHTLLAGEGIKTVYMRAQDTLGNITADYTDTITLDISNPIVTGNYPTSGLSISNGHTVIFDRSGSDTNMSGYTLYVNGDSYTTIATNYTINNISNGNYTWHVVATDRAGNTGTSTHIPFSIATSLSPIMKLLTGNLHYTTARYTKDYVALSLWTNTSANYIFTGDFSTPTPPFMGTGLNGAMTGNFILTTGDGIKNIYLQVSDGIITTGKTFVSYLDTTAPSIPTLISPISGGIATGAFTLARSTSSDTGVGLSGYQYFLSRTGTFATLIKSGFTSTPSTTLTDGEIGSSGTFYWYIKTIDTLGNSGTSATQSFSYTGTLDTQPNAFVLNTLTGVLTNRIYGSNTITIAGLSANTPVLASIDRGTLFINGTMVGTTGYVQNGSTVKIELVSSNSYNTLVTSTLNIGGISSSFRITTESEDEDTNLSKTTKLGIIAIFNSIKNLYTGEKQYEFLDSFMIMLQSKIDDLGTNSNNTHIYKVLQYMYTLVEKYRDTLIGDPDIFNVPWIINNIYTAPNGKKYTITFDAIKRQFTSPNFLTPQYFITLNALKYIIDLHNPAGSRYLSSKPIKARWGNIHIDGTRQTSPYIAPNRKVFYFFKTMEGKISSYTFTVEKYFNDLHSAKEFLHNTNLR